MILPYFSSKVTLARYYALPEQNENGVIIMKMKAGKLRRWSLLLGLVLILLVVAVGLAPPHIINFIEQQKLVHYVKQGIFQVYTMDDLYLGATAWCVSKEYFVSDYHEFANFSHRLYRTSFKLKQSNWDEKEYIQVVFRRHWQSTDLALMKVQKMHTTRPLISLKLGEHVQNNEALFTFNTVGNTYRPLFGQVIQSKIMAQFDTPDWVIPGVLTSITGSMPGCSGTPVFSLDGSVVGMIIAIDDQGRIIMSRLDNLRKALVPVITKRQNQQTDKSMINRQSPWAMLTVSHPRHLKKGGCGDNATVLSPEPRKSGLFNFPSPQISLRSILHACLLS